jgi:hypothetical protein
MADLEAVVRDLETKGVTFIDQTEGPLVTMATSRSLDLPAQLGYMTRMGTPSASDEC